jgi:CRP/FNR family cyclic AMP-dependent transcriptional regulator
MDKIWHLKRFNFFTCLSQSEMVEFSRNAMEKRFKKKEMIFIPGDQGDRVYLLKSGVVKISKYSKDGKEIILGMVNPGEIFGEMALVDKAPRENVAEALMDSYVCIVNRDLFMRYLQRNPEMSFQITKIIGLKFKKLGQKVEDLVFRNVFQRLAGLLINLVDAYGYDKQGRTYIYVKLTHYDIASLIGSTRETTTASLNEFKREGLITFDGRKLVVLDRDGLGRRAQS